jgi:hypothetical protein
MTLMLLTAAMTVLTVGLLIPAASSFKLIPPNRDL